MFTAEAGVGRVSEQPAGSTFRKRARIEASLVATGFPSRKRHQNVNVHFYYQLAMLSHGVRRAGSAALDLAYVACGRLDAFWEFGLNPWDMAAGVLLMREAGGTCTDMHGGPLACAARTCWPTTRCCMREMLDAVRGNLRRQVPFPAAGNAVVLVVERKRPRAWPCATVNR